MPKLVDHDEYRKELLEKCFNLFCRKGYANVTMREIADETGVSTGTLYHYFPTKQEILEQMFTHVRETNVGLYMERIANIDSKREIINTVADFWKEHEEFYQNLMLLAIDLLRQDADGDSEKIFSEFSDYYTNAISSKLDISYQFAKSIFIYMLGLVFHALLTPKNISYAEQISVLQRILIVLIGEDNMSELSADKLKELLKNILSSNIRAKDGKTKNKVKN